MLIFLFLFQSTPPRGWRPKSLGLPPFARLFQSTPPRGWRHCLHPSASSAKFDFNPLHHEGGDSHHMAVRSCYPISIHSTTRVETLDYLATGPLYTISIHSTTRVETYYHQCTHLISSISIHSTTRVETPVRVRFTTSLLISIHSTTRVETPMDNNVDVCSPYFNPLHHEGGDVLKPYTYILGGNISIHSTTRVETNVDL